jgi:hypothetical protein
MRQTLILVHRWLGVAVCLLFLIWFPSGMVMMYWDFPSVTPADRLKRSPPLDPSTIRLAPAAAARRSGVARPRELSLSAAFDGRPVYHFASERVDVDVYADTGEERSGISNGVRDLIAARWTGQPVAAAQVEELREVDQWTVQRRFEDIQPLWKYSWPDGQQVYVSQSLGEVVQYTTRAGRIFAYLGAIPHWLYFAPLRRHASEWSRLVIWVSATAALTALAGVVIGAWTLAISRRRIPYRGWKRQHMIIGLLFGTGAVTWAFSGMLSMDPLPSQRRSSTERDDADAIIERVDSALRPSVDPIAFIAKSPAEALNNLGDMQATQLDLVAFAGVPSYVATLADGRTRVIPVDGKPQIEFDRSRIIEVVGTAAGASVVAFGSLDHYDRYYLDRRRMRPLPVLLAQIGSPATVRLYIDPKTARMVGAYAPRNWVNRWLYHALHSLDFPWLYEYRPLWDVIVLTFMVGGSALSMTSLVLAWGVLGRLLTSD